MALEMKEERGQAGEGSERWKMKETAENRKISPASNKIGSRYFFFSCPALDLWSVGATRKEAERRLRDEMLMLLMRCSRYDELDLFLSAGCFDAVEVRAS
jgi:hypothetical protein